MNSGSFDFEAWSRTLDLEESPREIVVKWLVKNDLKTKSPLRMLKIEHMDGLTIGMKLALVAGIETLPQFDLISSMSFLSVSGESESQAVIQQKSTSRTLNKKEPDDDASSQELIKILRQENANYKQENANYKSRIAILNSYSKSHIEVYNDNEGKMSIVDADIVFSTNKTDASQIAEELWTSLPIEFTPPASGAESEHQTFFERVLDWTISELGKRCQLRFKPKPHLYVIPDVGLFAAKDSSSTWETILVPCEVESAVNEADDKKRKEGIGQALSYSSRKLANNIKQSFVYGLFTTSWHIEIFKQIIHPEYMIIMTGLLPFIPSPKPTNVTSGFIAFIQLLTMSPYQLGFPTPFLQSVDLLSGGHINIEGRLGTGGFSDVYISRLNAVSVAIKSLRDMETTKQVEMYNHEYDILSELQMRECDNIPKLHDQCRRGFELILTPVGTPLREFMSYRSNTVEVYESIVIINGVLSALKASHALNITHLDLRIENVIVTLDNMYRITQVVLIDWGLARKGNKHIKGISGTLHSAASEICKAYEENTTWEPRPEHDLESVMYLYVALREGEYKWFNELRTSIISMLTSRNRYVHKRCDAEGHLALFRRKLEESKVSDDSLYDHWEIRQE